MALIKNNTHGNDIAATKCMQSVVHILEDEYKGWEQDFIKHSFYLPLQVLKDGRWKVEPIQVITGKQFEAGSTHSFNESFSFEGANYKMLCNAQKVGVSIRTTLATNFTYVVFKIWYGKGQS